MIADGELYRDPAARRLAAGLSLRVVGEPHADELAWLERAASERGLCPPAGLVADVGALVLATPAARPERPADRALRRARTRYEDGVVGALSSDRRLQALKDATARLDPELRLQAVALVASCLADRLLGADGESVPMALLRRLSRQPITTIVAEGQAALREDPNLVAELAATYDAMAAAARGRAHLLDDADVFVVENVAVLGELGQRLAVRQIAEAASELAGAWPARVKPRRRRWGNVATALHDESSFPAGGFASLAQASGVANLVPSELIYMETDREAGSTDAFDVRYAEGALLHYVRDEGVVARERRHLYVVLDGALVEARVKDADLPYQRVVVLLGWLLGAVRQLEAWLHHEALRITVAFTGELADRMALARERELCGLVLGAFVDKGLVEVADLSPAELDARLGASLAVADTRAVWLGSPPPASTDPLAKKGLLVTTLPSSARPWEHWQKDGAQSLVALV